MKDVSTLNARNSKDEGAHERHADPMAKPSVDFTAEHLINREISWLAFNGRVLQEAGDPRVPLLDRLSFLAIFSSNLDEFFRVRVAGIRSLLRLKKQ